MKENERILEEINDSLETLHDIEDKSIMVAQEPHSRAPETNLVKQETFSRDPQ